MELLIENVSTYGGDIDGLIILIAVIVGFWLVAAEAVLFWLIFRFRERDAGKAQYITGEKKSEMRYISIPHALVLLCDIIIIIGAVRVWVTVKQTLPDADATVRVIGQQWAWTFVHPGADGKLDTPDDIKTVDELHIVVDTTYHYKLQATDVLHSFSIPVFRLKQDAIPGREITGWFEATNTGTYEIQCAEMCGIGHGIMYGRIVIETPEEHEAWIAQQEKKRAALVVPGETG